MIQKWEFGSREEAGETDDKLAFAAAVRGKSK